jgi:GTP:adenosylcobinamide-phosphate guanylyltransferase
MPDAPVTIILLAGQRAGVVNPLAARAGVSHKCLAPIYGKPLIAHVLDTVTALPAVRAIRISLEPEAHGEVGKLAEAYAERGIPIKFVANARNIVDSVHIAAGEDPGPFLITTADNVLLTREGIGQVRNRLELFDGVLALARKESVLAAHPEGQRGFYRFRDDEYANCNIYALADRRALEAGAEIFRGGGQFMKSVWRMVRAFGPINILMLRLGAYDRQEAMRRLGRRLGMTIEATEFTDGSLAIDVDNERTYRVCEEILARRETQASI